MRIITVLRRLTDKQKDMFVLGGSTLITLGIIIVGTVFTQSKNSQELYTSDNTAQESTGTLRVILTEIQEATLPTIESIGANMKSLTEYYNKN